ncbi:hypothetical protein DPMN_157921 [Dreissena polymorpha]|uniref:Uncharacterized protein n=1 Tax=Dreissena polymorpha TaxID=45954 RepID=A0A9D4ILH9_DREPO|nr:hypothetical protein DPMN_157921 [Dreissena polymorpha]
MDVNSPSGDEEEATVRTQACHSSDKKAGGNPKLEAVGDLPLVGVKGDRSEDIRPVSEGGMDEMRSRITTRGGDERVIHPHEKQGSSSRSHREESSRHSGERAGDREKGQVAKRGAGSKPSRKVRQIPGASSGGTLQVSVKVPYKIRLTKDSLSQVQKRLESQRQVERHSNNRTCCVPDCDSVGVEWWNLKESMAGLGMSEQF